MKSATQKRPLSARDLSLSERRLVVVLQQLGFGRLEFARIHCGEVVLDPWPTVVRVLKSGSVERRPPAGATDFELKNPMAAFFEYIRGVDEGEIRCLEVRHGQPFSMEIEHCISRGMPDVKGEHVEAV